LKEKKTHLPTKYADTKDNPSSSLSHLHKNSNFYKIVTISINTAQNQPETQQSILIKGQLPKNKRIMPRKPCLDCLQFCDKNETSVSGNY
jgi:hypothetical protein